MKCLWYRWFLDLLCWLMGKLQCVVKVWASGVEATAMAEFLDGNNGYMQYKIYLYCARVSRIRRFAGVCMIMCSLCVCKNIYMCHPVRVRQIILILFRLRMWVIPTIMLNTLLFSLLIFVIRLSSIFFMILWFLKAFRRVRANLLSDVHQNWNLL